MRGPEEPTKSSLENGTTLEGETCNDEASERDPCSSPPCKRLKQVLDFRSVPLSQRPSSSNSVEEKLCNGGSKEDATVIGNDADKQISCGGLVTAAPSPPNNVIPKPMDLEIDGLNNLEEIEVDSLPSTPVSNQSESAISPSPLNKSTDSPTSGTIKTPIRSSVEKKKEERDKMKEEKKKEKEQKLKEKQETKAAKEKEKLEAKQKKEQEKENREKEKMEKKMKEDKEKQEKKEKREEERKKKEEEQSAKLEEKKRKEEEKKQQEEELERKKMKAKNSFKSFFTITPSTAPKTLPKVVLKFEPFEIKPHMSLAPVQRVQLREESVQTLDTGMNSQNETVLYFGELQKRKPLSPFKKERRRNSHVKSHKDKPMETKTTVPTIELLDDDDDDDDNNSDTSSVVEIPEEEKKAVYMNVIFLKFHENNRPPYYGTHRKTSKKISPKNPFKRDEALLNYEVDSDDEWEEEEPGESLSDSEPEGDNEEDMNEDGDEEDDGWMVPHGYLSDDEGVEEGNEEANLDAKKEQQLAKAKAWEVELKKKCKAMKPVCVGCLWPDGDSVNELLQRFEACLLVGPSISINAPSTVSNTIEMSTAETATYNTNMYVPEEAIPDLIQILHGTTDGVDKLVNHFQLYWSQKCNNTEANPTLTGKGHISKRQLNKKIKAIAKKESRAIDYRSRWYVHPSVLASYGLADLKTGVEMQETNVRMSEIIPPSFKPGIIQFTKPVTQSVGEMPRPHVMMGAQQVVHKPTVKSVLASTDEVQILEVRSTKPSSVQRRVSFQTIPPGNAQITAAGVPVYLLATNQTLNSHAVSLSSPTDKRRVVFQTVPAIRTQMTSAAVVGNSASGSKITGSAGNNPTENQRVVIQTLPAIRTQMTGVTGLSNTTTGNAPLLSIATEIQSNTSAFRRVTPNPVANSVVQTKLVLPGKEKVTSPAINAVASTSGPTSVRRVQLQIVGSAKVTHPDSTLGVQTSKAATTESINASQVTTGQGPSSTPSAKRRVVLQTITPANTGAKASQPKLKEAKSSVAENSNSKNLVGPTRLITQTEPITKNVDLPLQSSSASAAQTYTESSTIAVKRQAPSPESAVRAAKVLKSEERISIPHNENKNILNKAAIANAENPAKENVPRATTHHSSLENAPTQSLSIPTVAENVPQCNPSPPAIERSSSQPNNNLIEGIQPMDIETIST